MATEIYETTNIAIEIVCVRFNNFVIREFLVTIFLFLPIREVHLIIVDFWILKNLNLIVILKRFVPKKNYYLLIKNRNTL